MNVCVPSGRDCRTLDKNRLYTAKHARILQEREAAHATADAEDEDNPPKDAVCADLMTKPVEEQQEVQFDEPNASQTQDRQDAKGLEGSQCIVKESSPNRGTMFGCRQGIYSFHFDLAQHGYGKMASEGDQHQPVFEQKTAETDIANVGTSCKSTQTEAKEHPLQDLNARIS